MQGGRVGGDQRRSLRGKSAERALIAAASARRVRRILVVDLDAERRGIAEGRLELHGDGGRIGRGDEGGGKRLVIGNGEELEDQRQRD